MKFSSLVVLTAFLGIASCDIVCMQFKLADCFSTLVLRHLQNPICAAHRELTECIGAGAEDCGVDSEPVVKDVIKIYTETCTEGTEMNGLFKEHSNCVFLTAALGTAQCMIPVTREVLSLGFPAQTRSYKVRVLGVACKYADSGNQCIDDNINRTCGPAAVEFRRRLSNPSVELSNQACKSIEEENNEIRLIVTRSVDAMAARVPSHNSDRHHHFAAAAPQVANLYLASTMSPHMDVMLSSAKANESAYLIHILAAIFLLKLFSHKYV